MTWQLQWPAERDLRRWFCRDCEAAEPLRYPPDQKQRTRKLVLEASAKLTKTKGFAAASVDQLMAASGMTGGAFYAHFDSKDALFSELITQELTRSAERLRPREGFTREQLLAHVFSSYLSLAHVKGAGSGCVIPALGAEISRAEPQVRRAFEKAMNGLHQDWTRLLGDSDAAWSVICQLVGAIIVARAMGSKAGAERVVNANRVQIARASRDLTLPRRGKRASK